MMNKKEYCSGGTRMFFKKKKAEEKDYYCVAHFVGLHTDQEKNEEIENMILEHTDNVGVLSQFEEIWHEDKKKLESRLPGVTFSYPCFAVIKIDHGRVEEEIKKLEKQHRVKKFLNLIPHDEYMEAQERGMYEFERALFFSNDVHETIAFLQQVDQKSR